ncbi:hypothetical protein [Lentzea sp. NPDC092896]|uniref:hypothetical protein n=1 Tax=Lentzea sp. NPDC092896 TaxID=3364127 RepID=UPI00382895BF
MTVYIHRELACDRGGVGTFSCNTAYHSSAGQTALALRREAKRQGWTRRDAKDFCPEHSAGIDEAPGYRHGDLVTDPESENHE